MSGSQVGTLSLFIAYRRLTIAKFRALRHNVSLLGINFISPISKLSHRLLHVQFAPLTQGVSIYCLSTRVPLVFRLLLDTRKF